MMNLILDAVCPMCARTMILVMLMTMTMVTVWMWLNVRSLLQMQIAFFDALSFVYSYLIYFCYHLSIDYYPPNESMRGMSLNAFCVLLLFSLFRFFFLICFIYLFSSEQFMILSRTIRRANKPHRHTYTRSAIGEAKKYNFIVFFSLSAFAVSIFVHFPLRVLGAIPNRIYLQYFEHRWAWSRVATARDTLLNVFWFIRILLECISITSTD